MNKVILIGNVGADAQLIGEDGTAARFSLATNESWTDRDGNRHEHVEWHNVVVTGGLVSHAIARIKKGARVSVDGSIRSRVKGEGDDARRYTNINIGRRGTFTVERQPNGNGNSNENGVEPEDAVAEADGN
jgi:single-strand DNA-binding protein